MKKSKKIGLIRSLLLVTVGSVIFALGFDLFLEPNAINVGGMTGLAMVICKAIGTGTVGLVSALLNVPLFLLLTAVGSAVWNTVLVTVGSFLGNQWENALPFFEKYSDIILVIAIILVVVFLIWWFGFRGRGKKANAEKE